MTRIALTVTVLLMLAACEPKRNPLEPPPPRPDDPVEPQAARAAVSHIAAAVDRDEPNAVQLFAA